MAINRFSIWLFILVLALLNFVASLTLEERVEKLEKDFNYMKRNLEAKVKRLEANVTRLETKVRQQESRLSAHLKSQPQVHKNPRQVAIHRTCHEARAANASLASGMYWIDPDGRGVGDDPIYVFCNMTTGLTSVPHDTENYEEVGNCDNPGCYSTNVSYSATLKQMKALAELSSECHQSIRYECLDAPLMLNNVNYSWWNDRNGQPKYFWSGNSDRVHICQCGIEGNCYESKKGVSCNCDSVLKSKLADSGVIADKDILPVTRLNFGRTLLKSSSGAHTLGRFECTGQVSVVGMSKSCADLWRIGHSMSGFYSVMGAQQIETVYCDFNKLPSDSGFQKWIGFNDVKSQPVYFYVQRNSSYFTWEKPIPFQFARLNIGNAMNLESGIFTAPRDGTYHFAYTGLASFPASSSYIYSSVRIYLNGFAIEIRDASEISPKKQWDFLSLHSTLNLKRGDQISLQIYLQSTGTYLVGVSAHYNHFSGWLLEENISQSLVN